MIALFRKLVRSLMVRLNRSQKEAGELLFINGNGTLPEPLTKEEEETIFARIAEGEEDARNELIVRNLRLVVYIAKKYENANVPAEDLVSIGTIGLIKAVRTFCPERNIKLATYASRCIENEILMCLRKTSNIKTDLSLDEPLNVDWDGNELLLSDILYTDDDMVSAGIETDEEIGLLRDRIARLGERDRKIISLRFGLDGTEEHTQKEVADLLGISQSYISRIEKRIIEALKDELKSVNS